MKLIKVHKIWDKAPHNAFTDLIRFQDQWLCVFREGGNHVSPDGALRIIGSQDGEHWQSVHLMSSTTSDLRDGKLCITPDNRLMLSGAEVVSTNDKRLHHSLAWFSHDGIKWTKKQRIGDDNFWLWRVTWHEGVAYSVGYHCEGEPFVTLYSSQDGLHFSALVERLFVEGMPTEALLHFHQGKAYCLLRREQGPGLLGIALPPYTQWTWKELGMRIGGPNFIPIPDGRLLAAVRLYDSPVRTALGWLDERTGKFTETLVVPSGGDTSYPGLIWHEEKLWMSYYSSHEGKTAIYFAEVVVE